MVITILGEIIVGLDTSDVYCLSFDSSCALNSEDSIVKPRILLFNNDFGHE